MDGGVGKMVENNHAHQTQKKNCVKKLFLRKSSRIWVKSSVRAQKAGSYTQLYAEFIEINIKKWTHVPQDRED